VPVIRCCLGNNGAADGDIETIATDGHARDGRDAFQQQGIRTDIAALNHPG
jgi:hypothetical protein